MSALMPNWAALSPLVQLHIIAAFLAIFTGAWMLYAPKGTQPHRRWGYAYVTAMVLVNVSVLVDLGFGGRFGIFHALALLSGWTLFGGMRQMILHRKTRTPARIVRHGILMTWSYYGLLAAFLSQIATRLLMGQIGTLDFVFLLAGMLFALSYPTRYLAKRLVAPWARAS